MAQDITFKQQNFVARYSRAVVTLLDDMNTLAALYAEWNANGYATGAPPVSGTTWSIPDDQVQAVLPAADAPKLNSAVGAAQDVQEAVSANMGYLIMMRP